MEDSLLQESLSCSALSSALNEQLFATAPRTTVWILVEYPFPPAQKALEESSIQENVKTYLLNLQATIPASRVLLIRQGKQSSSNTFHVFVGLTFVNPPQLYAYQLTDYAALVELEIPSLAAGDTHDDANLRTDPLYLVCTNSKRDPCCAQWGTAVFNAAAHFAGDRVWQTSHVGGHRFAANLIYLPHGIYFGRVRPDSAASLFEGFERQTIDMKYYRGRASYPPEAQAAEYFLSVQSNAYRMDSYLLTSNLQVADHQWVITFDSLADGNRYEVGITARQSDFSNYESCSTPDQRSSHLQYFLEGWSKK